MLDAGAAAPQGGTTFVVEGTGKASANYAGADENLTIHKYHLLNAVGDLMSEERKRVVEAPRGEVFFASLATALSTGLLLATSDFHDAVLPANVWAAIAWIALGLSSLCALIFGLKFKDDRERYAEYQPLTKYDWVDELMKQMEADRARVAALGASKPPTPVS